VPYKYRSRKIEQIMFRNLADRPLLYTLRIKRANGTEFSSEQTFEPRISPNLSAANDPVFWRKLRELSDPEVTFELVSSEREKPYYTELVDMNDLRCIGDNLTLLKFADKSIMILMVP